MDKRFKVRFFQYNTYEVLELQPPRFTVGSYKTDEWDKVYQGSLADCEAYIRLRENGYM